MCKKNCPKIIIQAILKKFHHRYQKLLLRFVFFVQVINLQLSFLLNVFLREEYFHLIIQMELCLVLLKVLIMFYHLPKFYSAQYLKGMVMIYLHFQLIFLVYLLIYPISVY